VYRRAGDIIWLPLSNRVSTAVEPVLVDHEVRKVLGLSHRVIVIRDGRVAARLDGEEVTEDRILSTAFGAQPPSDLASESRQVETKPQPKSG
jgi:ABC-type sugar transport system ATPase subunit